ncbi:hypothetical protein [Streptomyces mayteni]
MDRHPEQPRAELREHAIALRRAGLSRREIGQRLDVTNNRALTELLVGEPPPEWTRRPNAKDDLRARARELREAGRTYDEIVAELGVSKSSVSLWVRDLPKPATPPERLRRMSEARWEPYRRTRDLARRGVKLAAQEDIGHLSDRELFLVGVGLYWAEGSKSKSYSVRERVTFVNSDPEMIKVYLAWLRLLEITSERLRFQLQIHETADDMAAMRFWQEIVSAGPDRFTKTTLKRHNPRTNRKNMGEGYRGCLSIRVLDGADLYCRIEGWWAGIVLGTGSTV